MQAEIVTDHMHNIIHAKCIEADLEYYENPKYHDTLHRTLSEAFFRPTKILRDLLAVGRNGVSLFAMASLLFYLHWVIALILFIATVPGIFVRIKYTSKLYKWQRGQTSTKRKASYFHWILTGDAFAKEIRLFNLGKMFIDRYRKIREQLRGERREITIKQAIAEGATQAGTILAMFGSYAFIAYQTFQGHITMGDLLLYYQAFQRAQGFLSQMLRSLADLYEDNLFLSDLFEFLDLEPKLIEPLRPNPVPLLKQTGIVFNHMSFQYPTGTRKVLEDITLTVRPGEVVALVGKNGAGKTSLIKLLCRLYDPTEGTITFDGIDSRQLQTTALRREISVIFQDYARYHLLAWENIWFGNIDLHPNDERIVAAARHADADDFITRLPHSYQTMIGKMFEDGEELSIGQWQKVALARAFLRDAQIIILDEPTSALDAAAEYEVFKKFRKLAEERTVILISHRFSTIRMADSIYVLNDGKIVESGSHEELIRLGGKYASMFGLQAEAYR